MRSKAAGQGRADGPAIAMLESVRGKVFLLRADKVFWEPAAEGALVEPGDSVRTDNGSTVQVTLSGRGYIRLLPQSEALVTSVMAPTGAPSVVVQLEQGRAWASVDVMNKAEQFIIITPNAVVNSRQAQTFIEARDNSTSCLDVYQGKVVVRPRMTPEKPMPLESHQRINMGLDQSVAQAEGDFDPSSLQHSCITAVGPAVEATATTSVPPGAPATATSTDVVETAANTGQETVIIETQTEGTTPETTSTSSGAATAGRSETGETSSTAGAVEDEYEEIEIAGNTTFGVLRPGGEAATSTSVVNTETPAPGAAGETATSTAVVIAELPETPETGAACDSPPSIINVFVQGRSVAEGDAALAQPVTKCGSLAKPVIRWSAVPKCNGISVVSINVAGKVTQFPGSTGKETIVREHTFEIADEDTRDITIKAVDSKGRATQFTFTITIAPPDERLFPRITQLMVNGNIIKENTTININADTCESLNMALEGIAVSDCGEINSVEIKAFEAPVTVYGTTEWTATIAGKESQNIPVTINMRDITGARSKPFKFNIEFTKSIPSPVVTIDSIVNNAAPGFGEEMDVYRNELIGGRLVVTGTAGSDRCGLKKVELSTDNGSTWIKVGSVSAWSYGIVPRDGTYELLARAIDENDNPSPEMFQPVVVNYFSRTLEEILRETFDSIIRAYQDKDSDTILSVTAPTFTTRYDSIEDGNRLDSALNGKFTSQAALSLRTYVTNVIVAGRTTGRVTFQWEANPNRAGFSKTGTFVFAREKRGWKLQTVEDDRTFLRYTDLADTIDVTSSNATITANDTDTAQITIVVRDSAENPVKDGAIIQLTASTGAIQPSAVTSAGVASVTYTAGNVPGPAVVTATSSGVSGATTITLRPEFAPAPPH
jgi:hypothetical protein